jgi:hypothetical protein
MFKWPMRGHFGHLRFKTFSMTPRRHQCEVFWALLSNSKHLGVPRDSKSPTLGGWVSSSHLAKVGLRQILAMVNSYNEDTRLQAFYQSSSYKAHHTMGTRDKTKQAWIANSIQTKGTSSEDTRFALWHEYGYFTVFSTNCRSKTLTISLTHLNLNLNNHATPKLGTK